MQINSECIPNDMGVSADMSLSKEWRCGWRTLIAGAIGVGLGFGLFTNVAGLFILPMQAAFGWSRSAMAIGPIARLSGSLLSPSCAAAIVLMLRVSATAASEVDRGNFRV